MSKEQQVINNNEALNAEPSKEKRIGCAHYKRRAKFVTPCCNKEVCENCGVRFGKYTCLICNLFDDDDKRQYHCDGCGICRVGGRDRFFHCERCNMCLPVQLQQVGHRCVENVSRSNCPVCLEDIHTSRIPCHIPDCGHLLHRPCFEQLLHSGHYACPTCQTSMIDMTNLWSYLDSEVAATPMPPEYADYKATILCKDCHKLSTVKFHVVGLKCQHCGAYNTCQTNGFHKESNSTETGDSSSSTSTSRSGSGSAVNGNSGATAAARPADEPAPADLPRDRTDLPRASPLDEPPQA
ncbi:unnamed protein product [Arctia plantaginis]|uniref:RING finger and CHY zinc finger domain-containing protein 1 n=1 Tax=Arctia plantaginis TaxID=874455 RepID=A0A8S1BHT9_ARCPL|nr:unnamed protein product [Arctia plantaginis]